MDSKLVVSLFTNIKQLSKVILLLRKFEMSKFIKQNLVKMFNLECDENGGVLEIVQILGQAEQKVDASADIASARDWILHHYEHSKIYLKKHMQKPS